MAAKTAVPVGAIPIVYAVTYQLCDAASPVTCTTSIATITISPPTLVAAADSATVLFRWYRNGADQRYLPRSRPGDDHRCCGDHHQSAGLTGLAVNGAGAIVVPSAANAPEPLAWCIRFVPSLLPPRSSATLTLTISTPILAAAADAAPIPFGGGRSRVFANDTISGSPASSANVVVTIQNAAGMTG